MEYQSSTKSRQKSRPQVPSLEASIENPWCTVPSRERLNWKSRLSVPGVRNDRRGMHDRLEWTSSTGTLVSGVNNDRIADRRLAGSDGEAVDTGCPRIFPRVFAYNPAQRGSTAFRNPWKVMCRPYPFPPCAVRR